MDMMRNEAMEVIGVSDRLAAQLVKNALGPVGNPPFPFGNYAPESDLGFPLLAAPRARQYGHKRSTVSRKMCRIPRPQTVDEMARAMVQRLITAAGGDPQKAIASLRENPLIAAALTARREMQAEDKSLGRPTGG